MKNSKKMIKYVNLIVCLIRLKKKKIQNQQLHYKIQIKKINLV